MKLIGYNYINIVFAWNSLNSVFLLGIPQIVFRIKGFVWNELSGFKVGFVRVVPIRIKITF